MKKYSDTFGSDIECPYCHYLITDSYEILRNDDETEEIECDECGHKFLATCCISVDYSCSPDCELNGEKHKWEAVSLNNGKTHDFCKVCDKCRPYSDEYSPDVSL